MPDKKKQITICPPDWLYNAIVKEAEEQDRSKAWIVEKKLEVIYKDKAGE